MPNKVRILQFTIAATKGGRTRYILNIWDKIDHSKFQFDFITFSKSKLDFEDKLIESGSKIYYLSCHPEENRNLFVSEFENILAEKYDAIEIHTSYWVSTIVEEMAHDAGVPKVIIHAHSTGINAALYEDKRKYYLALHAKVRNQLDENIATDYWACSKEAACWLYGDNIPKDRIEILYNTIDTFAFRYRHDLREKERIRLGLRNRFVIGFVGRLEKVKNVDFVIRVFRGIREICPNAFLLIVGGGNLYSELKMLCINDGLESDTLFTGLVDNVSDYLQVMDLFYLPSFFEAFPIALLEAQCCGLPCITSNVIPDEMVLTEAVVRLPLAESMWIEKSRLFLEGYDRCDFSSLLKTKGFDTEMSIFELEQKYLR